MLWIIDTDLFIEGERGNPDFIPWLESLQSVATTDIVRGEYLIGVSAVDDSVRRQRGLTFYNSRISGMQSLPNEAQDYPKAAELAGDARRLGKGSPGLIDGLIAAVAMRLGATVATRNIRDFQAMGCACQNPLQNQSPSN
jgi:predicted nucleic acid-binding protein